MSFVTTTTMIPVSSQLKSLGVITDSHMCFHSHVRAVVRSCNYHTRALRHVRKHLTTETTHTIACSVISSRIDYCNSLLYWRCCCSRREAAESSKQRRQSYVISICVSARRLLNSVHRLPVQQCIKYRIAVVTHKALSACQTEITLFTVAYLWRHTHSSVSVLT